MQFPGIEPMLGSIWLSMDLLRVLQIAEEATSLPIDLTGMMSVVMVYFFGNLAIRTPSPCKEATGYCPHGGCPDVITPGAPYKVTSCYLIPSSSIDKKSTYISLIFSKESIRRFYPDMANYTISHH